MDFLDERQITKFNRLKTTILINMTDFFLPERVRVPKFKALLKKLFLR